MLMETTKGYTIHFLITICHRYTLPPVNAAVGFPSTAVHYSVDQSVPRGSISKTKYPLWFFCLFKLRIRKKNYSHKWFSKEKTIDYIHGHFSKYRKFAKTTVKSEKLAWLKSIDGSLKTRSTKFWKYMSIFRKNNSTLNQSYFDGTCTDDPGDVAATLPKHFHITYSYTSQSLSSIPVYCSNFLTVSS
jgi:hypothetical protein